MSAISYAQAKNLVLSRLKTAMTEIPVSERGMPRYIMGDPVTGRTVTLSILDLISNVEMNTAIGKAYVYDEAKRLDYVIVS